jgi:Flp pilus assembly protein TadD
MRIPSLLPAVLAVLIPWTAVTQTADVRAIAQRNEAGVLVITGARSDNGNTVQSSGGCVDPRGYVLTTAHQVKGVKGLVGKLADGRTVDLTVVEMDEARELALLKADAPLPNALRMGDATALVSGAPLVCIAAPVSLDFTTVTGIVSNTNRTYRGYPVIQTDFRASPGSSGGPVFDEHGLLVGLVIGKLAEEEWVTVVNPITNALPMLQRHGVVAGALAAPEDEMELYPAPGISEGELRAVEAYNRGTKATSLEEKLHAYQLATQLLPAFFEAWFNLGLVREQAADLPGAEAALRKATALRPDSEAALRTLGRGLLAQDKLPEAEQVFVAAAAAAPASARAQSELGEVYRRMERFDDAAARFEAALEKDANYALAMYNLAVVRMQQARAQDAAAALERYLVLRPDAPERPQIEAALAEIKTMVKEN